MVRIRVFFALTLLALVFPIASRAQNKSVDPRARAAELVKQATVLLVGNKPAEAEAAMVQATDLDPQNPIYLYNLACTRARQPNKREQAVEDLARAAAMGFTDFPLIGRDPDLDSLRKLASFQKLLGHKEAFLRHTAEGTLAALRNRFGDAGYRYEIDDDQRLIFAVAMDQVGFEKLRSTLREQAKALDAELFEHKPEAYVTVLMPTSEDYGKMVRFRNVPGMYVDDTKSLVAKQQGLVLNHEFTHALHAADRAPSGQVHATWIAEGLGAMCEACDFADGHIHPRDNPRFSALPPAARRKALVPLERLFAMKQEEFVRRPNLTYGQSAYLMLYLWEKGLLRKFYETYKSTYASDATGRKALERVTGKALPDFQDDWRQWLTERGRP